MKTLVIAIVAAVLGFGLYGAHTVKQSFEHAVAAHVKAVA